MAAPEVEDAGESGKMLVGGIPAAAQEVAKEAGDSREMFVDGGIKEVVEKDVGDRRKLFVGGIPAAAKEVHLRGHFACFGAVRSAVVMLDRVTGLGRGFGFVEFEDEDGSTRALGAPRHFICGRMVDVKRARARPPRYQAEQPLQQQQKLEQAMTENDQPTKNHAEDSHNHNSTVGYASKKVFIGGWRDSVTDQEAQTYFQAFGNVTDVALICDSVTGRSRGFGFVTFDSEEALRKVVQIRFHDLNGTKVEAKIAIPKNEQFDCNGRGRVSRPFGGRGPVPYDVTPYQPYNDHHGFYNAYMPQPVPAPLYYPGFMGATPYANVYPNQGAMSIAPNMVPMHSAPVYNLYPPMYQGYGFGYGTGYQPAATPVQYGVNGAGDYKNDQAYAQEVDSAATMLEHMKLGPQ